MNVGKEIERMVSEKGEKIGLVFEGKEYTWNEIGKTVNRYANFLKSIGAGKGEKVAIYLPNMPEYIFLYFAIFKIGGISVPLDSRLKIEEIIPLLSHSGCKYLFTYTPKGFNPSFIKEKVKNLKEIITISENYPDTIHLNQMIDKYPSDFPVSEIDENSISSIFYTSGTTGIPKGVIWTYRHLDSPLESLKYYNYIKDGDITVCPLPLSHNGGIVKVLLLFLGVKLVLMERYSPLKLLELMKEYRASFVFLVPSMFVGMLNLKEFENTKLPHLRWVAVFGAPSSPELLERFRKTCPDAKLFSGYGLTESAAPNVLPPLDKIKPGSVGKPVPWMEVKIIDENGKEVPAGKTGEIIMKGWPITPGYYNQPELTKNTIKDGWLYTGDIGKFDEDGYLYIVGRKKDMIIVGGLNVYATEVENVIFKHPKVKEVAVVGVAEKLRGEAIKAVIVPKEGEKLTEDEIKIFCRKHLASYKVPTIIEFRDSLPKTGSGKIKKELLK